MKRRKGRTKGTHKNASTTLTSVERDVEAHTEATLVYKGRGTEGETENEELLLDD